MPTKSVKPESEMTTEEFLESLKEVQPADKKKPKTIGEFEKAAKPESIPGYFGKRKKIMEELDK
jgi:hypothetical protein